MLAKQRKSLIRKAKAEAREHRANARCAREVGEDRAAQEAAGAEACALPLGVGSLPVSGSGSEVLQAAREKDTPCRLFFAPRSNLAG